ncbi:MAG: hypothetical protein N2201_06120 [candidate division WOR-3 bacterium]|nr:hypothetical protein [candidate division WOR-3 bacterium]
MAVRNALRRVDKWDLKLNGDVLSEKVATLKPMMKAQIETEFPALVEVENEVKAILGEIGITSSLNPPYLNFARETYRLSKRFLGKQLLREVDAIMAKWLARGFDKDILERIRNTVFTLTASTL